MPNTIKQLDNIELTESTNLVRLVGTIKSTPVYSHSYDDVLYYSIRLEVNRNHGTKHDNIHVFIPKDNLIIDSKLLDSGARIRVRGKLVQSELQEMSDISVVADELGLVEEGTKDENIVYIGGTIHRLFDLKPIKDTQKVVKQMILKHSITSEKGTRNLTVKISCWNNIGRLMEKYSEGDKIIVRGQIESKLVKSKQSDDTSKRSSVLLHEVTAVVVIDLLDD